MEVSKPKEKPDEDSSDFSKMIFVEWQGGKPNCNTLS